MEIAFGKIKGIMEELKDAPIKQGTTPITPIRHKNTQTDTEDGGVTPKLIQTETSNGEIVL